MNFDLYLTDGLVWRARKQPCFIGLNYLNRNLAREFGLPRSDIEMIRPLVINYLLLNGTTRRPVFTDYLNFIAQKFPYVVSRNATGIRNKGLKVMCNAPATNLFAPLVLARYIVERPGRVEEWNRLVKMGCSQEWAAIAMHLRCEEVCVKSDGFTCIEYENEIFMGDLGHSWLDRDLLPLSGVKNFLNSTKAPKDPVSPPYWRDKKYTISDYFRNIGDEGDTHDLLLFLSHSGQIDLSEGNTEWPLQAEEVIRNA